jgi:hypothetical protein
VLKDPWERVDGITWVYIEGREGEEEAKGEEIYVLRKKGNRGERGEREWGRSEGR